MCTRWVSGQAMENSSAWSQEGMNSIGYTSAPAPTTYQRTGGAGEDDDEAGASAAVWTSSAASMEPM